MNTSPTAGVHSLLPPDPRLRGTPSWEIGNFIRRGKDKIVWSFLPRGHGPLPGVKFESICVVRTPPTLAEPGRLGNCWRQSDHRRTKQVGRHQAACNRNISLQILMAKGPCGPGVGGKPVLILPAGNYEQTKVTRSRKWGLGGKPPVSIAAGWMLTEGVPQRIFGYFLCEQKVTSSP